MDCSSNAKNEGLVADKRSASEVPIRVCRISFFRTAKLMIGAVLLKRVPVVVDGITSLGQRLAWYKRYRCRLWAGNQSKTLGY